MGADSGRVGRISQQKPPATCPGALRRVRHQGRQGSSGRGRMDAMSYLVLARKWRPKRFAELVGQEHVVRALSNALDSGRVHHAHLFTGTRGVGKTALARIFAKSLNCEPGTGPAPAGGGAACLAPARKWRPKRFAELVGQEHVVRALSNALDSGRVHHAHLFTGTRGVGKTAIARIFAKSLNCERGTGADPCGECETCLAIDAGRYIDLLEIDAASNTGVDNVRDLIENAQYMPSRGRYKMYLIDEVHMLSKPAFNALLKQLEEPPEQVKLLVDRKTTR